MGELRGRVETRVGPIVAQNQEFGTDEVSRRNLLFTSLLLATHQELQSQLGEGQATVDLLRDTLMELFRPRIRDYIRQRFDPSTWSTNTSWVSQCGRKPWEPFGVR